MQTQSNKFQELIGNYAFQGRDVKSLSKDQLLELVIAYLAQKKSRYPWSECKASDSVDVSITMGTLVNLCSNLYNTQQAVIEAVKDAVIESCISDIDEILDEEIERMRNRYSDDSEYLYEGSINLANVFNATRKQMPVYKSAGR